MPKAFGIKDYYGTVSERLPLASQMTKAFGAWHKAL